MWRNLPSTEKCICLEDKTVIKCGMIVIQDAIWWRYYTRDSFNHIVNAALYIFEKICQQECIPVGCIPPASVAVSDYCGWCLSLGPRGCLPLGLGVSTIPPFTTPPFTTPHPLFHHTPFYRTPPFTPPFSPHAPCGQTNTCENITLTKLRLQMVIIDMR